MILISTCLRTFYVIEKTLLSPAHEEPLLFLYDFTRQYAAVDIAKAKVIEADMLCRDVIQMENSSFSMV